VFQVPLPSPFSLSEQTAVIRRVVVQHHHLRGRERQEAHEHHLRETTGYDREKTGHERETPGHERYTTGYELLETQHHHLPRRSAI
jgi:hypothetical protein